MFLSISGGQGIPNFIYLKPNSNHIWKSEIMAPFQRITGQFEKLILPLTGSFGNNYQERKIISKMEKNLDRIGAYLGTWCAKSLETNVHTKRMPISRNLHNLSATVKI